MKLQKLIIENIASIEKACIDFELQGAPRIEARQGQTEHEPQTGQTFQLAPAARKIGIQPVSSDVKAQEKQAHDAEIAVPVDELLHAHPGALNQELERLP